MLAERIATQVKFLTSQQLELARSQIETQVFCLEQSVKKHWLLETCNHAQWTTFRSLLIVDQKTKALQSIGTCPKKVFVQKDRNSLLLVVDKLVLKEKRQMQNSLRFHMSSLVVMLISNSLERNSFHQREQNQRVVRLSMHQNQMRLCKKFQCRRCLMQ